MVSVLWRMYISVEGKKPNPLITDFAKNKLDPFLLCDVAEMQ